jgi:hypothetical protein
MVLQPPQHPSVSTTSDLVVFREQAPSLGKSQGPVLVPGEWDRSPDSLVQRPRLQPWNEVLPRAAPTACRRASPAGQRHTAGGNTFLGRPLSARFRQDGSVNQPATLVARYRGQAVLLLAERRRWCPQCGGALGKEKIDVTEPPFVLGWYREYGYLIPVHDSRR